MSLMRRYLAKLAIALLLLAVYLPLCSPISSEATNTSNIRFGFSAGGVAGGSDAIYADLLMCGDFGGSAAAQVNSQGYPTQVGATATIYDVINGGYPSGNYQFYGEGKFTMGVRGWGTGWSVNYQGSPNNGIVPNSLKTTTVNGKTITTALINISMLAFQPATWSYTGSNNISFLIDITPTDANDLPANFHLMRPDVPAWYDGWTNDNSIFGKEFIQALSGKPQPAKLQTAAQQEQQKPLCCCIRFISWMYGVPALVTGPYGTNTGTTNNYGVTDWASRPSPTFFSPMARRVCYENMIELCNELNCDMWVCIPFYAATGLDGNSPSDWCSNFATLVKQKLHPNLHCYYEIADELWNWGGSPYWYNWEQVDVWAQANPKLAFLGGGWLQHGGEMGLLIMNVAQIMQPILGNQGRAILAGQFAGTSYCSGGLQYIAKYFGAPAKYIYGIAGAPYFYQSTTDPPSTPLIQSMEDFITQTTQPQLAENIALAQQYNVKYCCYEAGQSLVATDPNAFAAFEAAQSDPGMATCYQNLAALLKSGGATMDICNSYAFCGDDSEWGFWGALQDIRQMYNNPPSVKYAAIANIAAGCNCATEAPAVHLTAAQQKAAEKAAAARAKAAAAAAKAKEEAAAGPTN